MAVSKRLRYEIIRRDNGTCRYCGQHAPDVPLTVDHVIPTTLGGTDEPSNLVAACRDCNSGKTSSNPDQPLVDDVAADALRWANAMRVAADAQVAVLEHVTAWHQEFDSTWRHWTIEGELIDRPTDWRTTVDQFREAGLPQLILHDSVRIAMEANQLPADRVWRYFCGVAWRRVEQVRADALASLRTVDPTASTVTEEEIIQARWLGVIREASLTLIAALDAGQTARVRDIGRYLLNLGDYEIACGHPHLDECTERCDEIHSAMDVHRPLLKEHLAALRHQPVGWPTTAEACA